MATGKARSTKRPTATSSYSSATTIVVFVGLSVLGLWLLTSNSFTPPQSTTTRITSTAQTHHSDEGKADEAAVIEPEKKKMEIDADSVALVTDHHVDQDQDSAEEAEKQEAMETQTSEESDMTIKQVEQVIENHPINDHRPKHDEEGGFDKNQQQRMEKHEKQENPSGATSRDQIQHDEEGGFDKNQQQRMEKHEKQENPSGATSRDPIQHDEEGGFDKNQQQRMEKHEKQENPSGATSSDQIQHDEQGSTSQETKNDSRDNSTTPTQRNRNEGSTESGSGDSSSIPEESTESKKSWTTQANQSEGQKERRKSGSDDKNEHRWLLCNETAGADFIPCLDNEKAIKRLRSRMHHQHRERHCPKDPPTCLVPLPRGYKKRIEWPKSRDKIWYSNVPYTSLAEFKGHQNWVKVSGEFLTFPGGGTQFIHGALHYIDFLQQAVPEISWGKHSRVVLDVGCGVASFGGYMFEKDVLTMSFAPKDEHEAQVQFALERGIPAISAVMGTQRLPFPSRVFDVVHCARCRVPWHADGGALLLELNRVLRPGGYFVWSATPVYQKLEEDVQIWKEMSQLTVAMCWELVTIKKDKKNYIGAAIYQKPDSNECYERRNKSEPPMCKTDDDPNVSWYTLLQSCMHHIPTQENERGSQWPEEWPERLQTPPYWLNKSQMGIYGKPAPDDFIADYKHWKKVVSSTYVNDLGINWSEVRNVMDLRAVYGGFAAALKEHNLWVMNVVNVDSPDTLPIIYERGLFGMYHDWCESFSTYPRSYDLLHVDHLFSRLKKRCTLEVVMAEIDRIVRPGGKLIVRDEASTVAEVEEFLKSLQWEVVFLNHSKNQEGILSAQKSDWRPTSFADSS